MARLNEPPIAPAPHLSTSSSPTESLEALKRRFIRQNRELAKNNSAQSLKIRSLESEVSKLLAHNLELRERNLALEYRLEKQVQNGGGGNGFKRALRRKLEELSGLVEGIDDDEEDETFVREEVDRERILSPTHQQYRERQPLGELMRDSQMPTINEGKSFPRLTLNDEEIRTTMRISDGSAATGSPDLGPPPVARFDCEVEKKDAGEEELMPSVNLETRRRRKEPSEREIRRSSILALSPVKLDVEPAATSMLKTGAKRKLADRDAEKTTKKDDFSFTRKPSAEVERENEAPASPPAKPTAPIKAPASPARPARKVLGDKSVNMSPRKTAPTKPTKPGKEDPIKPAKDDPVKPAKPAPRSQSTARPPSRGRRTSSAPNLLSQTQNEPAIASIELPPPEPSLSSATHPPKAPAPPLEDFFSPEPSASASQPAAMSRDTPPPSDLSSLSNTTTDARPSRRARSSVNYAEPSLVAKMRRPGKGMVDAISGLPQSRRSISADVPLPIVKREVEVKIEPVDDEDVWASKGSPLRGKERGQETESEESSADKIAVAQSRRQSAVVAESRKKREAIRSHSVVPSIEPATTAGVADATADKLAEMDLYDFKEESGSSSPVSSVKGDVGVRQKTSANGRRHSSVLKPATTGSGEVLKVREKVEGAAGKGSRRRSMMI